MNDYQGDEMYIYILPNNYEHFQLFTARCTSLHPPLEAVAGEHYMIHEFDAVYYT